MCVTASNPGNDDVITIMADRLNQPAAVEFSLHRFGVTGGVWGLVLREGVEFGVTGGCTGLVGVTGGCGV